MKCLLDTHTLLWWLADDPALSQKAKKTIALGTNTIFVSAVSVWEIAIKKNLGKLAAPDNLLDVIRINRFFPLSITLEHAYEISQLPPLHIDPFDRILIAQAMVEDLVLITRDQNIKKYTINILEA